MITSPWHGYNSMRRAKKQAKKLSAIYFRAGAELHNEAYTRRAVRVAQCCETVGVQAQHIVVRWLCDERLCPICAAAAARRVAASARCVIERAQREHDARPYMLTLTQRNCAPAELEARITDMIAAWRSIVHDLRAQKRHVLGYARTIEITIGRDGSYHPHLHAILLMAPSTPQEMLRARYWALLWQRYMATQRYQGEIIPICHMQRIRPNPRRHFGGAAAAAAEVAKYTAKPSQVLERPDAYDRVLAIDSAIHGRQLRAYGGIWRQLRAEMRLDDSLHAPDPDAAYVAAAPLEVWRWAGADYVRIT